jgi:hypothetical protein
MGNQDGSERDGPTWSIWSISWSRKRPRVAVVIDELGCVPFSQSGGQLLF